MRSIQSWIVERLLAGQGNKKTFTDPKLFAEYMEKRRVENDKPYVLPEDIKGKFGIEKKQYDDMDCYIFNQETNPSGKKILYLHGGGYVEHPIVYHWRWLGKLAAETTASIYVPIYPKAPNHQYKASFDKVLPIYEELLAATDNKNIVLMGDSAGGGFALSLAQLLLEKELPQPRHIMLLSPWLDITLTNPEIYEYEKKDPSLAVKGLIEMGKAYAGDTDPTNFLLSPINGKVIGLGEITIFVGTHEAFLPDARKFRDLAESQGVSINYYEYPKMNHVFPLFPIPEAKKATRTIVSIINGM
ncbi:alpha/beta hydrolase [Gracilibacillus oryzae]|uniref:Alpha/beta hydrolase n=1 Tax=Gracilibacillus oryzae TaxID=1672701 RepID=A0A7C8KWB1_9BACI|nr:alpha/beta hydrolase [Gracilibacillus oryzae]KAB8138018.1 alpha/beta hydrolase [Gracilibacillus oryzae]